METNTPGSSKRHGEQCGESSKKTRRAVGGSEVLVEEEPVKLAIPRFDASGNAYALQRYQKFMCFCDNNIAGTTKEIDDGTELVRACTSLLSSQRVAGRKKRLYRLM